MVAPVLSARADLLAKEARIVAQRGITWNQRLKELRGQGLDGGDAADRKRIVVLLAEVERGR